MSKLKTLKDIDYIRPGPTPQALISIALLRAEAIKWIKWFPKAKWEEYKEFHSTDEFGSGHEGLDAWIKHFFNITDEELSK